MAPLMPIPLPDQAASPPGTTNAGATELTPRHAAPGRDRPGIWLYAASLGLCVLAGAAATVSFSAQYRLVYAARHLPAVAGLEAAIPDAAALVFACLGVALALHGRLAIRARVLNAASAGASVFMNVIAAAPGWRDLAVWAMPPAAYALASDTLIGVVRAWVLARRQTPAGLAAEISILAAAGGLALWLLRLSMAPVSTLAGFRTWVLEECPVAPGRRACLPGQAARGALSASSVPTARSGPVASAAPAALPRARGAASRQRGSGPRRGTKTARFLALVAEQHGPLAAIPLTSVGRISAALAPAADLNTGAARAALRRTLLTAHNGDPS